jgi:hypothetical protein
MAAAAARDADDDDRHRQDPAREYRAHWHHPNR